MNKDYEKWKNKFYNDMRTERLGQYFINCFIRHPWPELYYEENDVTADKMIRQWLTQNHFYVTVPNKIK